MTATCHIEIDGFEGPLDLLLHLVRKHELDIFDIPIAFITEKYLAYLDLMASLHLDIAGEYLLMAATLCHIKSRELLPNPDPLQEDGETGEEGADPRQELIRRLLEYQKYKQAAEHLDTRPVMGRNVWTRGASADEAVAEAVDRKADTDLAEVPIARLLAALDAVLRRAKIHLAHDVTVDRLSVADRISELCDRLDREPSFAFSTCFSFVEDGAPRTLAQLRHEIVVTFLAILEMARLLLIRLAQPEGEEDIVLSRTSDEPLPPPDGGAMSVAGAGATADVSPTEEAR
jgi:segregation and condensation protein A